MAKASIAENPVVENETDEEIDKLQEVSDALPDDFEVVIEDEEPKPDAEEESEDGDDESDDAPDDEEGGEEAEDEDDEEGYEAEEDEEEDDEEDLKSYSKNVQKRIKREVKLRKDAENQINQVTMQRNQVVQVARQVGTQLQAEHKRYDELEDKYVELLESSMSGALQGKQSELIAAKDEGDTANEIRLQSEMDELRNNIRQLGEYKGAMPARRQARNQNPLPQATQQPQGQQQQPVNPRAAAWVERNKTWLSKPENRPVVAYTQSLEQQLLSEGKNPDTDAYYKEMDKRLKDAFPKVFPKRRRRKSTSKKKTTTAPVAASSSTGKSGNRIVLTKADLDTMRNFGMDPTDKEHLKEFAKQKMAGAK